VEWNLRKEVPVGYACLIGISGFLGLALYPAYVSLLLLTLNRRLRPILRTVVEEGFSGEIDFRLGFVRVTVSRIEGSIPTARGRASLVQTLTRLSPGDMATLVTLFEGAASHVSHRSTVAEQVTELVRWAESPTGPGFAAFAVSVANFCSTRRGNRKEPRRV